LIIYDWSPLGAVVYLVVELLDVDSKTGVLNIVVDTGGSVVVVAI
jgi:hypothetical protein